MKCKLLLQGFLAASLVFPFCLEASTPLSNTVIANNNSIAPILKKSMPAVVNITATGKVMLVDDPFLRKQLEQDNVSIQQGLEFNKSGSGIIIDSQAGLIVTNAHLVSQAQILVVNLNDGRKYVARVLGVDNDTDIALLQIRAKSLTALPMANSNNLKIGDFVAAIGNPFGLQQTVTSGIVSSLHRSNLGIEGLEDFIQTDASINNGNSGGALINAQGQLVGMNTAILASSGGSIGIGFAIPSNMIHSVVIQLLKYGRMNRGILGVAVQNLNPQLADALAEGNQQGAVVTQVVPYSPAALAGIQAGDIISSVNGQPIQDNGQVRAIVGLLRVGDKVQLTVKRQGKVFDTTVAVGNPEVADNQARAHNPYLYGVNLENTTEQLSNNQYVQGVKVITVELNSLAWSMGLEKGDIIVSANLQPVHNITELQAIAAKAKEHLLLRVVSIRGSYFILLQ